MKVDAGIFNEIGSKLEKKDVNVGKSEYWHSCKLCPSTSGFLIGQNVKNKREKFGGFSPTNFDQPIGKYEAP